MATFAEVVEGVRDYITNPSRDAAIRREVNNTLRYFSRTGSYTRDLREVLVSDLGGDRVVDVPLSEFPRYRNLKWVRNRAASELFTLIDPASMGAECPGSYYVAGNLVRCKGRAPIHELQVGYYALPPTLYPGAPETYWMLDVIPDAVIQYTVAVMQGILGDQQAQRTSQAIALVGLETLRRYQDG